MEALWFCLLSFVFVGYVLLDGYDLGVGLLHLFLAKNESEKKQMFAAIAPFWDANEVWLLAAGGTAFFAFPKLYASSFSGFYLPLTILLWLLILRGIGIEFRAHIENRLWSDFFDAVFSIPTLLLPAFFRTLLLHPLALA